MSLGSSHMAGNALGTASSLLFLASIIQGLQDVQVVRNEEMEALEGEDITLPCSKPRTDAHFISVEWGKKLNESKKLAVFSPQHGVNYFSSNINILTDGESMGFLQISKVSKWDSGVYTCDLSTFPDGSIRRQIRLEIKEITCDANRTLEVHPGGNVSIHCLVLPNAQYSWTKNEKVVSARESLELWQVTEAQTGVYTLNINAGNKSVQKEFLITVLTKTPCSSTDPVTLSPVPNVTETGLSQTTEGEITTTPTTELSTVRTTETRTMSDETENPTPQNISAPFSNHTPVSVTPTPDPFQFNNSTYQEFSSTLSLNTSMFSDQPATRNSSTTASYESTTFRSTQETRNESRGGVTETTDLSTTHTNRDTTRVVMDEGPSDTDGARSHLVLVIVIVLLVVLIALAGFLYRRRIIKQRMDLPPPFKPPPPPVKYESTRQDDIHFQHFPTSRCNSVAEPEAETQSFVA